jgi:ribose 5-phosphate isomerase A
MDSIAEAGKYILSQIGEGQRVGWGDGSTVRKLLESAGPELREIEGLTFFTSSATTREWLVSGGFALGEIGKADHLHLYVDGCDQVDSELNALKSGGGIHTREKLFASMADQFILMGTEAKYVDHFDGKFPVVLEVIPDAAAFVTRKIREIYPESLLGIRQQTNGSGPARTERGNLLVEMGFADWPELSGINPELKKMTGVLETSLFYGMATKLILLGEEGIRMLERTP